MNLAPSQASPRRGIVLVLALGTLALFARTVGFDFVLLDDPACVYAEPMIKRGLSWEGLAWSFKAVVLSHWKPLVNLSHMLDCELFGLNAGAHHAVNVGWHAATAVMVFLALERLTGSTVRSAIVAALWAWHPLRVESVAWVTERKDVLSGFFAMATVWAYAGYARAPSGKRYGLVCALFALGLLSKSALVTLPFALLLLDWWPLGRWRLPWAGSGGETGGATPAVPLRRLILEKVPLVGMAAATAVAALWAAASSEGIVGSHLLPLWVRTANAAVSIVKYAGMTFWPVDLACYYPYRIDGLEWKAVGAGLLLLALTGCALWQSVRRPFVAVGWFWFLGMLVPMLGLVQAGGQAMADRYTYLPHIGLFTAIVWLAAQATERLNSRWRLALAVLAAVALGATSFTHIAYWRDSRTLFERALAVTRDNWFVHTIWGELCITEGRPAEALPHLQKALKLQPTEPTVKSLIARALFQLGRTDESRSMMHAAIAHLARDGYTEREWLRNLELQTRAYPDSADLHFLQGTALSAAERYNDAGASFRRVLKLAPTNADAHVDLGVILARQQAHDEAIQHYQAALRLNSKHPVALANLGGLLLDRGQATQAAEHLSQALALQPSNHATRYNLALALMHQRKHADAARLFREILQAIPNHANALNRLAWLLATSPEDSLRNGAEALQLALRLQETTGRKNATAFDTEGAALAECGRFEEAAQAAQKAQALFRAAGQQERADAASKRATAFETRKPWRE